MGSNGFTIRFKEPRFGFGGGNNEIKKEKRGQKKEKKSNLNKPITKFQAESFKENYQFPAKVSLVLFGIRDAVVSFGSLKTNPTVRVFGGDENFVEQNGFTIAYGRSLTPLDVSTGRNVCIIGKDVAKKFFGDNLELPH